MGLILLIIAAIVLLVTGIWLLIIGFQRSVWWGLAMLFIPFASLVFVIMYWQDAKKPFLISLAALPVYFYGIYQMSQDMDVDPEQLAQVMHGLETGEIKPNEAFEHYGKQDSMAEGEQQHQTDIATGAQGVATEMTAPAEGVSTEQTAAAGGETTTADEPATANDEKLAHYPSPGNIKPDPLQIKKPKSESPTIRINPDKIASYQGRYFIITTKDGKEHRGLLRSVNDKTLFLYRKLYGGDFEYHVARNKIAHADMLKEEYVKEYMEKK